MPNEIPCWGCLVSVPAEWLRAYNGHIFCPECWRRGIPQTLSYPPAIGDAQPQRRQGKHRGPVAPQDALWDSYRKGEGDGG